MQGELHKYVCWLDQVRGIGRKTKIRLAGVSMENSLLPGLLAEEKAGEAVGNGGGGLPDEISGGLPDGMPGTAEMSAGVSVEEWSPAGLAGGAKRLYEAAEAQLRFWCAEACPLGMNAEKTLQLLLRARKKDPSEIEENLFHAGIGFSCILEESFPDRLRTIPDPPFGLYWRGELPESGSTGPCAAVIGARLASGYGRAQARRFGRGLAQRGITVISGMARGIDGIAQSAALEAGGKSYAVLGCGVDLCYPEENRRLYELLLQRGGLVSEYPPGTPPDARNFPQRNRIISGLSDLVLVIEARRRSGTLITVDMALEQGREVFAVPGRVSDALSDGCNCLIRQGAGAATCPKDIAEFFFGVEESPRGPKDRKKRACEASAALPGGTFEGESGKGEDCGKEAGEQGKEARSTHGSALSAGEGNPEDGAEHRSTEGGGREEVRIKEGGSSCFSGKASLPENGRQRPAGGKEIPRGGGRAGRGSEKKGEYGLEEPCGVPGGSLVPQSDKTCRKAETEGTPLEAAILRSLSTEDEIHLERLLEAVNQILTGEGHAEVPLGSLITVLLRLQIGGRIEETSAGYYRRRSRWEVP